MSLQLIQLPMRVVFVDDSESLLDSLRMSLRSNQARQYFTAAPRAVADIRHEIRHWLSIESSLMAISREYADGKSPVAIYASALFANWRRFQVSTLLVVDYSMPELNGLQLAQRLQGWPGRKILLTGEADAAIAVQAFNKGLINRFIPMSTPKLYATLTEAITQLHNACCDDLARLIRGTLDADQILLLQMPSVESGINTLVRELRWIEYVVVGRPFGLLGMRHDGPLQWVQLETDVSSREMSQVLQEYGRPEEEVARVRAAVEVSAMEISMELNVELATMTSRAIPVSARPRVVAGVFELPLPVLTREAFGLDDIRSPRDEGRAILRNCVAAFNAMDARLSPPGGYANPLAEPEPSLRQTLQAEIDRLAGWMNQSEANETALGQVMADVCMPASFRTHLLQVLRARKAELHGAATP